MDEDSKAPATTTGKENPESMASGDNSATQVESNSASVGGSCGHNSNNIPGQSSSGEGISREQVNKVAKSLESIALAGTVSEDKG